MMDRQQKRSCQLRALRSLNRRKRSLDFYLYDDFEYNMGSAASIKSKDNDLKDDLDCQLEAEPGERLIDDVDTEFSHIGGSKSSLFRNSNTSLGEVDVSLGDCKKEQGKKLKTNHVPNRAANHQDAPIFTRARLTSKRLGTPFVGNGMSIQPPRRRESITSTKGIDLLQIHEEPPYVNKSNGAKESVEETPPSRLARILKMDNTDILRSGRNGMFTNNPPKPFSNTRVSDVDKGIPTLHHVSQRKPGTTAILNQLGKQGIVSVDAATERSIGEMRQARMLEPNMEDMPYIPSMDAPRRHAPRLAPITHNKNSLTDTVSKPPWERSVLANDRNFSRKSLFDFDPPLFNASGKSWCDDVMPLEIRHNTGCRLKVNMMDDPDNG
ncbi:hypothetical protein KP79_PYT10769 [Mizuhopecten yessoensis]|uniref:Uncharacterized protein n=1 Tax=Mizuhopecten yessoensis TaxID=6573 RepID=A0A210PGW3_MIZYE|nr:hypothetical protein KP79_PYT10769 [Mizuhopecten yessoensis]